jgi:hypothetical protein
VHAHCKRTCACIRSVHLLCPTAGSLDRRTDWAFSLSVSPWQGRRVPEERMTWSYLPDARFYEGKEKVAKFQSMLNFQKHPGDRRMLRKKQRSGPGCKALISACGSGLALLTSCVLPGKTAIIPSEPPAEAASRGRQLARELWATPAPPKSEQMSAGGDILGWGPGAGSTSHYAIVTACAASDGAPKLN